MYVRGVVKLTNSISVLCIPGPKWLNRLHLIQNLDTFWTLSPCFVLQPKQIGDDFCGLVLNQPLGGLRVIEGTPLYDDGVDGMGALTAYTYGDHSVVFVGTRSGRLKKVRETFWFFPFKWADQLFPGSCVTILYTKPYEVKAWGKPWCCRQRWEFTEHQPLCPISFVLWFNICRTLHDTVQNAFSVKSRIEYSMIFLVEAMEVFSQLTL